ncbi:hypothetical protein [Propionivibrio soli]|uniref:hypothetical protein n=1 Tax=Propionivibrio soli TaxID=2976531 RepID=UPI0021E9A938|nr:hypothetical protein [Propionivibrio soli]
MSNARRLIVPLLLWSLGAAVQAAPSVTTSDAEHEQHHAAAAAVPPTLESSAALPKATPATDSLQEEAAKRIGEKADAGTDVRNPAMQSGMPMMQAMHARGAMPGMAGDMMTTMMKDDCM